VSAPTDNRQQTVDELPRRTAHALHALLACAKDIGGPVIASEVVLYDSEAPNARGTAQALRAGARRGYCFCIKGTWWTTNALYEMQRALEDRYLRDTEDENDAP
jgi:hypothetical protein